MKPKVSIVDGAKRPSLSERGGRGGSFSLDSGRQLSGTRPISGGGGVSLDSGRQLSGTRPISGGGGVSLDSGRQLSGTRPISGGGGVSLDSGRQLSRTRPSSGAGSSLSREDNVGSSAAEAARVEGLPMTPGAATEAELSDQHAGPVATSLRTETNSSETHDQSSTVAETGAKGRDESEAIVDDTACDTICDTICDTNCDTICDTMETAEATAEADGTRAALAEGFVERVRTDAAATAEEETAGNQGTEVVTAAEKAREALDANDVAAADSDAVVGAETKKRGQVEAEAEDIAAAASQVQEAMATGGDAKQLVTAEEELGQENAEATSTDTVGRLEVEAARERVFAANELTAEEEAFMLGEVGGDGELPERERDGYSEDGFAEEDDVERDGGAVHEEENGDEKEDRDVSPAQEVAQGDAKEIEGDVAAVVELESKPEDALDEDFENVEENFEDDFEDDLEDRGEAGEAL